MPSALLRFVVSACAFILVSSGADLAPPDTYEGRPISAIRFDPPAQPVTQSDLQRLRRLQPGTPLRLADVREAIKSLYTSGVYTDIEIEAIPDGNAVALVI